MVQLYRSWIHGKESGPDPFTCVFRAPNDAQTVSHYRAIENLGGAAKKVYIMSVRCLTQSPRGTARVRANEKI
jgi:hypothetical protein